MKYGVLGLLSV